MYDMKVGIGESTILSNFENVGVYTDKDHKVRDNAAKGLIGPGPQCFLLELSGGYNKYPVDQNTEQDFFDASFHREPPKKGRRNGGLF